MAYANPRYPLRYRKSTGLYEAGRCTFDPMAVKAWSYGWCFVTRVNGKVVFNEYNYSPTTRAHQEKVREFMEESGFKIDVFIDTSYSIAGDPLMWIGAATRNSEQEIGRINAELLNPRTKHKEWRFKRIAYLRSNLDKLNNMGMNPINTP